MHNPNVAMRGRTTSADLKARYAFTKGLPTRDNCDPTNPKEAFLWMLVAGPGVNGGPMFNSIPLMMMWSEHFWECGARPVEEPVKKYQQATGDEPNWSTTPGRWVSPDTPDIEVDPVLEAIAPLNIPQRAALFRALRAQMSPTQKRDILLDGQPPEEVAAMLADLLRELRANDTT